MKAVFICASVLLAAYSVFGYIVNDMALDERKELTEGLINSGQVNDIIFDQHENENENWAGEGRKKRATEESEDEDAVECTVEIPANAYTNETAASVPNGSLVTYACNNGYRAVGGDALRGCQATGQLGGEPLNCVLGCPEGWRLLEETGHCYRYFGYDREYTDAQSACKFEGGIISTAKTQAENDLLLFMKVCNFHIYLGLDDNATEGEFRWNDGTLADWENWNTEKYKNSVDSNCAIMNADGVWIHVPCSKHFQYVCKVAPTAFESSARQQYMRQLQQEQQQKLQQQQQQQQRMN